MDASSTLRAFFDEMFRPFFLADARPRTLEQHLETLQLWELLTDKELYQDPTPTYQLARSIRANCSEWREASVGTVPSSQKRSYL